MELPSSCLMSQGTLRQQRCRFLMEEMTMPCPHCKGCAPSPLSEEERHLLDLLSQQAFLPVARFLLQNPENPELSFVMAGPVFLETPEDSSEKISAAGKGLLSLQKRRYLTLDYDLPLDGFDYGVWEQSRHYQDFVFASQSKDAVPVLERGSAALTLQGQEAIDEPETCSAQSPLCKRSGFL